MNASQDSPRPLIHISGDWDEPFFAALMDLYQTHPEKLNGLIEVDPVAGSELSVTEIVRLRPQYMKMLDRISQLLQDHGFEEASKFLDCSYCL